MLMCILSNLVSITRITGNTSFRPTPCNSGLSIGAELAQKGEQHN